MWPPGGHHGSAPEWTTPHLHGRDVDSHRFRSRSHSTMPRRSSTVACEGGMWGGCGVGWREKSTGNHGFYPPKSGMSSLGGGELGMDLLLYFRPASGWALRVVWHVAIINPKQKHSSNLPQAVRAKCLWSCWNLGVFFHQTRTAAQALPWMKISGTQCSHRNNVVNSI